jgi:hypothetical protein
MNAVIAARPHHVGALADDPLICAHHMPNAARLILAGRKR